jgi:hypothetical protein
VGSGAGRRLFDFATLRVFDTVDALQLLVGLMYMHACRVSCACAADFRNSGYERRGEVYYQGERYAWYRWQLLFLAFRKGDEVEEELCGWIIERWDPQGERIRTAREERCF